jgi:hypothetical protein
MQGYINIKTRQKDSIDDSESMKFLKVETIGKKNLIELSKTKYQGITTNVDLSDKDYIEIEIKKKFNNKSTSIDLVMVQVPLITIYEVVDTPMNTKISNINMMIVIA